MDLKKYLPLAIHTAIQAGERIMEIYNANNFGIEEKPDQSPVTTADLESSAVIYSALAKTNIPVITEEMPIPDYSERKTWESLWMVDPLDGTKEFIKRNGEFTVNIALIHHNIPVLGIIYIPVQKLLYFGAANLGSFKYHLTENQMSTAGEIIAQAQNIKTHHINNEIRVAVSRSHLDQETLAFIDKIKSFPNDKVKIVQTGSSLKFCLIAEGLADIYLRFSPTMEWDTAAGHAIVMQAGAKIKHLTPAPVFYNKPSLKNDGFYISNAESFSFADFC